MNNKRSFSLSSSLLAATMLLGTTEARAADPGVTDTEVKIGATTPASGPAAVYYEISKGAKAYFDDVNAKGGVNGRKINYILEDDGYTVPRAVQGARKLVEKDKVFSTFLSIGYGQISYQDYLVQRKVPHLFPSEGSDVFTGKPNIVRGVLRWQVDGHDLAAYIAKTYPGKRVAILHENSPFSKEGIAGAKPVLEGKVTVSAIETYEPNAVNVDAQMAAIVASKPDVVLLHALPNTALNAIKYANQQGLKPHWVTSYVNVSPEFISIGGAAVEGTVSGAFVKLPDSDDPAVVAHKKLLSTYAPGSTASVLTLFGQADAEFFVDSLRRSGKEVTRANMMKSVESMKDFKCTVCLYPISLSATDHETFDSMKLMQVKGGHWVFID